MTTDIVLSDTVTATPVANPFGRAQVAAIAPQNTSVGASVEQREVADVQAQYLMAEKFPRNERRAVDRIIDAFGRPGLAESATYEYGRGGSAITGPSIRAAEAIAQQWGNLDIGFSEVDRLKDERGVGVSVVRAQVRDLQNRTRKYIDFRVPHWRDTKQGGYPLRDERDIYELIANQAQRRVRACILASVPGDVVETAMKQADATLKANVDATAEGIAKLVAAFAKFGVTKEQIEKRVQRRADAITAGQMVTLRRIYVSMKDGMSEAKEWFDTEEAPAGEAPAVSAINERIAAKRRGPAPGPTETAQDAIETEQPGETA